MSKTSRLVYEVLVCEAEHHVRPMNPERRKGSAMMMGMAKRVKSTIKTVNGTLYRFGA